MLYDPANMTYVKSLDGIRALAVLVIMFFHLRFIEIGWIGVQVFFVLSGYLITAILMHDREQQSLGPYLARFYWRRTLRIFPLYYGYLLAITIARFWWDIAPSFERLWPYLYGYGMNFANCCRGDPGPAGWFVHFWSLAIEEQFYLVWPWLVFFVPKRTFWRLTVFLVIATPLVRFAAVMTGSHTAGLILQSPVNQLDAFGIGAVVAQLPASTAGSERRWFGVALGVTLAVGLATGLVFDLPLTTLGFPPEDATPLQSLWRFTLINVTAALLILASVRGRPVTRLLEHTVLVRMGRVSYGMYVFHFPLILASYYVPVLWRVHTESALALPLALVYVLWVWAVAEMSYFLFERRFLALKDRAPFGWSRARSLPAVGDPRLPSR